jgi:hypothetical protein
MGTFPLFYEDIYDALVKAVNSDSRGLSMKQISCELWPARNPDTARGVLSRALNPENNDVRLAPEEIVRIMDICGPEHVLFFLCDRFSYERPVRKEKAAFEREIKKGLKDLVDGVNMLGRKVEDLERMKEAVK